MKTATLQCCLTAVSAIGLCTTLLSCARAETVAIPENANTLGVLRDGETYLELAFIGWGPKWQYLNFAGKVEETVAESRLMSSARVRPSGATVSFETIIKQAAPRQLRLDINLRTDKDTELTYVVASLEIPPKTSEGGKVLVDLADGARTEISLPLARRGLGEGVKRFTVVDVEGQRTVFSLEPACDIGSDGAARIVLAGTQLATAEPKRVAITIDLPETVTFHRGAQSLPQDPGFDQWFPFQPTHDYDKPSELGMTDWMEGPAGAFGRVTRDGAKLTVNGKPLKLWGTNVCFSSCAPDKDLAEKRAKFYAKYGINSVRLHKYADGTGWAGIQAPDSVAEFDADGLDRMDYFVAKLKERGIFVKLSAHFGSMKMGPGDKRDVPYMDEFGELEARKNRIEAPHSAYFYSPELQNLQIRQTINLLRHKNPYTGLTYAEDPAIAFVEIINEQSILFYSSMRPLSASPTLRAYVAGRFSDWLKAKYGSHDGLVAAWGARALNGWDDEGFPNLGEHLGKRNLLPLGNPWFWDPDNLHGSQAFRKRRLLDTLEFLYTLQCEAYSRYVKAVRNAGYQGEVVGSNWQAGRAYSHYYNLHSDARVGVIDRHNYFGGGGGGKIDNVTMLRVPGSGMLSAGTQQVSDLPFMLSEWIHVAPNEWGVEGPAIIGAYGMGLQGWDVSYMFQNRDVGGFAAQVGKDRWEVTAPQVMGVFPAVARQVRRGDVTESDVLATRFVHVPSLRDGRLGFNDQTRQAYDVKSFDSDKVPAGALAVARSVVDFTDEYCDTPAFDLAEYQQGDSLVSATGQLRWTPGKSKLDGFFTVDTPATKAVVGFANGRKCQLGNVTISPQSRFGSVYVTAKEADEDLTSSKNVLVVAIARARNTGMKVFDDSRLMARGGPPVLMEPVKASITIAKPGAPTVHILDHDGCRTGRTLPINNGAFEIDGARDKTCYYSVAY